MLAFFDSSNKRGKYGWFPTGKYPHQTQKGRWDNQLSPYPHNINANNPRDLTVSYDPGTGEMDAQRPNAEQ